MRRNLPQPLDAGVLRRDGWIKAPGDGAGDEGGALLLEQLDQPLLLYHQRIDPRRLPVEECGDGALLWHWWQRMSEVPDEGFRNSLLAARTVHIRLSESAKCITECDVE